jgi:hypothetical protein
VVWLLFADRELPGASHRSDRIQTGIRRPKPGFLNIGTHIAKWGRKMAPPDNLNANGGSGGSPWNIIRSLDQRKTEISKYGYAVLGLFAIAATIATWAKGGNLVQIIVLVFLVFGLAIAVWAFQKMAKARSKFWKAIGLVAAVVVLVSVLSVFVVILKYIITGTPQNLDRFFGEVELPGRVFGASIESKATNALIVRWDPYRDPEAKIFVSYGLAASEAELTNHGQFNTDTVSTTISGLEPQTKYRIRLVAEVHGRRSEPVEIKTFTNANLFRIGEINNYTMLYTGGLTSDGIATSDDAEIVFLRNSPYDKWVYRGAIKQGKPFGWGELKSRSNKCDLEPPNCSLEFRQDGTITGNCTLFLKILKIDNHFQKIDCLKYTGAVANAADPGDMVKSNSVGPYIVELKGRGEIENLGNNDEVQIKGSLEDGLLNGWVRMNNESEGLYNYGQYHRGRKKKVLTLIATIHLAIGQP